MDYKTAGVDVIAGENAVKAIKTMVRESYNSNVLSDLGSFGGLYKLDKDSWHNPILVSSADGVGTKLRVAIMAGIYNTVGQCLVNHCVNDILVQGAHPQFFLDYIGLASMDSEKVQQVISGLVKACKENGCALIGGEMAEMPGIYHGDDFDLVGTIIGMVEQSQLLPRKIVAGDVVIGLKGTGLHTNGYSLARKIVFEHLGLGVDSYVNELGLSVAEELLKIHPSYYSVIHGYLTNAGLHGLAHITGGGIPGNLKRIIPDGLKARLRLESKDILPVFHWLKAAGDLDNHVMMEAFNLGIGMIAVLDRELASDLLASTSSVHLGEIVSTADPEDKVELSL